MSPLIRSPAQPQTGRRDADKLDDHELIVQALQEVGDQLGRINAVLDKALRQNPLGQGV